MTIKVIKDDAHLSLDCLKWCGCSQEQISRKGIIPEEVYGSEVKSPLRKSLYTPEWEFLCDMLTQIRLEHGVTQVELASRLGQPQSFVCKVESGQRKLDLRQFVIYVRCLNGSPVHVLAAFIEAFPPE